MERCQGLYQIEGAVDGVGVIVIAEHGITVLEILHGILCDGNMLGSIVAGDSDGGGVNGGQIVGLRPVKGLLRKDGIADGA